MIGRPGILAILAVPSTMHGMLKFPVNDGIVTIYSGSKQTRAHNDTGVQAADSLKQRNPTRPWTHPQPRQGTCTRGRRNNLRMQGKARVIRHRHGEELPNRFTSYPSNKAMHVCARLFKSGPTRNPPQLWGYERDARTFCYPPALRRKDIDIEETTCEGRRKSAQNRRNTLPHFSDQHNRTGYTDRPTSAEHAPGMGVRQEQSYR